MKLTPREIEVLRGVVSGKLDKQIAHEHGRSRCTIKTHVHSLYVKSGVRTRVELAIWGMSQGIAP